jgi:uncharacterized membrane protein YeaQ/YmgE (transglycosylase-associated protein family)
MLSDVVLGVMAIVPARAFPATSRAARKAAAMAPTAVERKGVLIRSRWRNEFSFVVGLLACARPNDPLDLQAQPPRPQTGACHGAFSRSGSIAFDALPKRRTQEDRMPGFGRVTGILIMLVVGLVVGATAKILVPGKDPGGVITTSILGIVGSLLGGWIGHELGAPEGFVLSVAGAVVILLGYRFLRRVDQRG